MIIEYKRFENGHLALVPFIHVRHFVHLALLVVRNPLPNLFASFKVPRPHFGAVLPEPLPISFHLAINDHPLAFYAAVFVVLDVFVLHGLVVPFPIPHQADLVAALSVCPLYLRIRPAPIQ
jgi:hypothetical protein